MKAGTLKAMDADDTIGNFTILVVDDDEAIRDSLSGYLEAEGWRVRTSQCAAEALDEVRNGDIDAVISDICMPGMDGLTLLRHLHETEPQLEVLISTGFSTEESAIEALKAGAFDYFCKPLNGADISASLRRTRRLCELKRENQRLSALVERMSSEARKHCFVGNSPPARLLLGQLEKVAAARHATLLISGETGVGKEVVARWVHQLSSPKGPFVALNCGGVAESLIESELFGHERGAFTGADKQRPGVFEMAQGGTVFLDEIGEMGLAAQSRLLRVLEERVLRRVGGSREVSVANTRVIAATNRDLAACVKDGTFREDLYYRIMVAHIEVPPLRDRRQDIPPLAEHFLEQVRARGGRDFTLSDAALAALSAADFPGNVRDLRNVIERATIFASGDTLHPADFGLTGGVKLPTRETGLNLAANERQLIEDAIMANPGNHSAAARALGITPQALYRKIEKHEIDKA